MAQFVAPASTVRDARCRRRRPPASSAAPTSSASTRRRARWRCTTRSGWASSTSCCPSQRSTGRSPTRTWPRSPSRPSRRSGPLPLPPPPAATAAVSACRRGARTRVPPANSGSRRRLEWRRYDEDQRR
ncbi:hypothetical protein DAI22_06g106000 [Oryza sativa Japonica Group]|nr:hypothetical protein DAI22_06g106000 [Oryza sativa Japonica Group]